MKTSLSWVVATALVLWATSANADVLSLNASGFAGGASGMGVGGAQQDDAFHEGAQGGAYGASVGVEFLLLDGWIDHTQYRNSDGLAGTWTQFMLGVDAEIGLGEPEHEEVLGRGDNPKPKLKPYTPGFIELGIGVGFGVGTGQQIDPPLDYTQVTDRGFLLQASAQVAYRLSQVFSLGLKVPVQWGYMFKKGVANDENNHYQSVQGAVLLNLQMKFRLK